MLTLHSFPGLRGHLGERQRSLYTRCTQLWGRHTPTDRHNSFQHTLLVGVVCECVKHGCRKWCLLGIVEECVFVCKAGADVTCRVTHSDTTAVWQTGQRGGRSGSCFCCCVCACVRRMMMRWDSWNELSKIPWDLLKRGSGIKSFGKSFVIDGDRKRGETHTHTHTHTHLPSLEFGLLQN